jgi:hypothetical protein
MLQEVAIPIAFARPLPARTQMYGGIDQERVHQCFEFELSRLLGVMMLGLDSVKPNACQRARQSGDRNVGSILVKVEKAA